MYGDLQSVRQVQEQLYRMLSQFQWLRGIGLTTSDGEPAVKVNVSRIGAEVRRVVPKHLHSVPIVLSQVGDIRAPPPPTYSNPRVEDLDLRKELLEGVRLRRGTVGQD